MGSYLVTGVLSGAAYGLLAMGFVLVYKGTRTFNLAHGEIGGVGLYAAWALLGRLPVLAASVVGVAVAALVALAMERLLVRRVHGQGPISRTPLRRSPAGPSKGAIPAPNATKVPSAPAARSASFSLSGWRRAWDLGPFLSSRPRGTGGRAEGPTPGSAEGFESNGLGGTNCAAGRNQSRSALIRRPKGLSWVGRSFPDGTFGAWEVTMGSPDMVSSVPE
jgi:hypothetical protein